MGKKYSFFFTADLTRWGGNLTQRYHHLEDAVTRYDALVIYHSCDIFHLKSKLKLMDRVKNIAIIFKRTYS